MSFPLSKILNTLLWLLLTQLCLAQNFDQYKLLSNRGPIPNSFLGTSTEKYHEAIKKIEPDIKARQKKVKKRFYLQSHFSIGEFLISGKVLFGTELNEYINQVADKLLEHSPGLRGKVEIYIARSTAVNAFATNQGIICINMGLLAQLENEAQLAFILAHELTHVQKSHSLKKYVEADLIDQETKKQQRNTRSPYRQIDYDETILSKCQYSKELEFEADQGGLELYLKTGYSLEELDGFFDVLKYAHLLFDEVPFNKKYFDSPPIVNLILNPWLK